MTGEDFEKVRKSIGFILAPLCFLIVFLLPLSISREAHNLAAILALVVVLWLCESIPLPVTSLLGPSLAVIFNVADVKTVFAPFSNPIIFVFMGSFFLAESMRVHELDKRIAVSILSKKSVNKSAFRMLLSIGVVSAALSMWLSNTATTAMLYPIAIGIIYRNNLANTKFSTALLLVLAYSASIGGLATPIGTPPNLIGIGMIESVAKISISFFDWMAFTVPLVIVIFIAMVFVLFNLFKIKDLPIDKNYKKQKKPFSQGEINTLIAFLTVVILWTFPGVLSIILGKTHSTVLYIKKILPEGVSALIAASMLFFLPTKIKPLSFTLNWKQAKNIDWGTIILFGGGMSLGTLMFSTKLAHFLGNLLLHLTNVHSLFGITLISIVLAAILTEITSNTASANVIIPLSIAMAESLGVNPVKPAMGACLGASLAFMLPVATPPNAIVYGSRMVPIVKMVKSGIVLDIICVVLVLLWVYFVPFY